MSGPEGSAMAWRPPLPSRTVIRPSGGREPPVEKVRRADAPGFTLAIQAGADKARGSELGRAGEVGPRLAGDAGRYFSDGRGPQGFP